jgi:hypothetical protein
MRAAGVALVKTDIFSLSNTYKQQCTYRKQSDKTVTIKEETSLNFVTDKLV